MKHALEAALVEGSSAVLGALPRRAALAAGAVLGDITRRLGLRARVARDNLRHAFPALAPAARDAILAAHYRELGRIVAEYTRLPELVLAAAGDVLADARGLEHLERARADGRGAILLSGHFGNIELLGAWLGRRHPVAFVVKPLSNPRVDAWITRQRGRAGVETIPAGAGLRRVYQALRANRWVAMLGDQDARRAGVFVPFLGRPASTAIGPARIALATGAPIVMGFDLRRPDGRHEIDVDPPLVVLDPAAPDAAERLTALHVAALERRVREQPELWFWLHRRWKTRPPAGGARVSPDAGPGAAVAGSVAAAARAGHGTH